MEQPSRPIYSTKEDAPELEDAISAFVIGLAEQVDILQDAESTGDWKELGRLAEALGAEALRLGYAPLAEVTGEVVSACKQEDDDAVREHLLDLTDLSYSIRRGHRGAV